MTKITLPKLIFGESQSLYINDFEVYRDTLHSLIPELNFLENLVSSDEFGAKSFEININGLAITTTSATPQYASCSENENSITLMIPIAGKAIWTIDNQRINLIEGKSACIGGVLPFEGKELSVSSWLIILIDRQKLNEMAHNMLGSSFLGKTLEFRLFEPREIKLQYGKVDFLQIFRELSGMIENYLEFDETQKLLESLRIDELFYRNIVLLLLPEHFFSSPLEASEYCPSSREKINLIKNFIEAYPYEKITLTDLEKLTHLSARSIQLMFKKELDTTPMQFIKEHRLELVHKRLQSAKIGETITSIAIENGFSNLSLFSKVYRDKYGTLPSHTLRYL